MAQCFCHGLHVRDSDTNVRDATRDATRDAIRRASRRMVAVQ